MKWKNLTSDILVYFITATLKDWRPLFQQEEARRILLTDIDFYRQKYKCKILAYVIMPEHYHIVLLFSRYGDIHTWLRDFQSHTAKELGKWLDESPDQAGPSFSQGKRRIWKEQARAVGITSMKALKTKINYIHENPIRRGLVSSPSDWPWSSWQNYEAGDDSMLRIDRDSLAESI